MRIVTFIASLTVTIALILLLNNPLGNIPPLGSFVSPQEGFWQNADAADKDFSANLSIASLKKPVDVYLDERLVPHIFASSDDDAYFAEGYLHAKFRLWQMEFQTHVAAGRLSEILGPGPDSAYLNNDRNLRRLGMVFGATRSLMEMEKDEETKKEMDAYTAGVNCYISSLTQSELPLEYRLLNYKPEKWTNLKTALFLKYMSFDLTGSESDIEYTNAKSYFSQEDFNKLYPAFQDSLDPIIPKGTAFPLPSIKPVAPADVDSQYFNWKGSVSVKTSKTDKDDGSNNWVVGGSKTRSGRPILCNDPHLGLNLPSLWYELQITTPTHSVYGVSFPGAPAVILGFNDSIAWGTTNAARDVRDYYKIQFKDETKSLYWLNGRWQNAEMRIERYVMKDGSVFYDSVAYTVFGPVMYDDHYNGKGRTDSRINLAVRWLAHDPSNELKTFALLNRAKNYNEYEQAIRYFLCPGQNFAFASKDGTIAMWQQGSFPAKWKGQGNFVMPGTDTAYAWQGTIPHDENPHLVNPERGFVSSANQLPADSLYPYFLGGSYSLYRGAIINRYLTGMSNITTADMQKMQNDNYNIMAEMILPVMMKNIDESMLDTREKKYLDIVRKWNRRDDSEEQGITVFDVWFDSLETKVWSDELSRQPSPSVMPEKYTLAEAFLRDTAFSFIDDVNTPAKETIGDILTAAFKSAVPVFEKAEANDRFAWGRFKDAGVRHLLRMAPLSRYHLNTSGGESVINATKNNHGPSWRMIVQLTDSIEAYGIYPGGQSGNPGSRYYDSFIDDWTIGRYNTIWVMKKGEDHSGHVQHKIHFAND